MSSVTTIAYASADKKNIFIESAHVVALAMRFTSGLHMVGCGGVWGVPPAGIAK